MTLTRMSVRPRAVAALRERVRGEVRTGAWGVTVAPRDAGDLVNAFAAAHQAGVPLEALAVDETAFSQVLAIDPSARLARVQPGCAIEALRHEAASYGLTFAPRGTGNARTVGEFVGSPFGSGRDEVVALDVLTNDGTRLQVGATTQDELEERSSGSGRVAEIYRGLRALRDRNRDRIDDTFIPLRARVTAYDLGMLLDERGCNIALALAGGERRLVTLLEVTCRLATRGPSLASATFGFSSLAEAAENAAFVASYGPVRASIADAAGAANAGLPEGAAWLCATFAGESEVDAGEAAESLAEAFRRREAVPSIAVPSFMFDEPPPFFEGGHSDRLVMTVPVDVLGPFVREFEELARAHKQSRAMAGDAGRGMLWTRERGDVFPLAYLLEVATLLRRYHGTLRWPGSEEHEYDLRRAIYGKDLTEAIGDFERIWLPAGARVPRVADPSEHVARIGIGEVVAGAGAGLALGVGRALIRRLFPRGG